MPGPRSIAHDKVAERRSASCRKQGRASIMPVRRTAHVVPTAPTASDPLDPGETLDDEQTITQLLQQPGALLTTTPKLLFLTVTNSKLRAPPQQHLLRSACV